MKNVIRLGFLSIAVLLLSSCKKSDDQDPYIIFWGEDGKWIETTSHIPVELNSTFILKSEIGYHGSPHYNWKINDGDFEPYSMTDGLNITTIGRHNGLELQKATWTLDFNDETLVVGDIVTIRLSDSSSMFRTLSFEVE